MTKRLTYSGQFKTSLLMDELFAVFPEWLIPDPLPDFPENMKSLLYLESEPDGTEIYLTVPIDADEATIQNIIDAHDYTQLDDYEQLMNWIRNNLQPAVGQDVRNILDLGTIQGKINVAILFSLGAINVSDYTILPLRQWLVPD